MRCNSSKLQYSIMYLYCISLTTQYFFPQFSNVSTFSVFHSLLFVIFSCHWHSWLYFYQMIFLKFHFSNIFQFMTWHAGRPSPILLMYGPRKLINIQLIRIALRCLWGTRSTRWLCFNGSGIVFVHRDYCWSFYFTLKLLKMYCSFLFLWLVSDFFF